MQIVCATRRENPNHYLRKVITEHLAVMDADPAGAVRTLARSNGSRSAAHGPILLRFVLLNSVYPKEDFKPKFFKIGQFL